MMGRHHRQKKKFSFVDVLYALAYRAKAKVKFEIMVVLTLSTPNLHVLSERDLIHT